MFEHTCVWPYLGFGFLFDVLCFLQIISTKSNTHTSLLLKHINDITSLLLKHINNIIHRNRIFRQIFSEPLVLFLLRFSQYIFIEMGEKNVIQQKCFWSVKTLYVKIGSRYMVCRVSSSTSTILLNLSDTNTGPSVDCIVVIHTRLKDTAKQILLIKMRFSNIICYFVESTTANFSHFLSYGNLSSGNSVSSTLAFVRV